MKVIVVSAHPDDEVLGCGGVLMKHRHDGDDLKWIIITEMSENEGFSPTLIDKRNQEIAMIKSKVGFSDVFELGHAAAALTDESLVQLVPVIGKLFNEHQPDLVYVVNGSDAHSDHNITFRATWACTKSFRYPSIKKVLVYECLSETEFGVPFSGSVFQPNYFVNISEYIDDKIDLMQVYESELGEPPFPRSIENIKALAHVRGSTIGVKYAEAFQLLKCIVD